MILDSFYGNDKLKSMLKSASVRHTLPHAVLIEGESGLGAGYLADLLSASIVCSDGGCGECISCRKFKKGIHPDIITLDRENALISVDDIRNLGASARIYPNDSDRKVYIIKNAHNMNQKAQNALLKLLEEPPAFVNFILSVESTHKLLDTVLSRCVCLKVEPVKTSEVTSYLTDVTGMKSADAAHTASLSYGFIGRALSLSQKKNAKRDLQKKELALEIIETLCFGNEFSFFKLHKKLTDERDKSKDEKEGAGVIFDLLAALLSDILRVSSGRDVLTFTEEENRLIKLSDRIIPSETAGLYDICIDTKQHILRNINYSACINTFLVRAWEEIHG